MKNKRFLVTPLLEKDELKEDTFYDILVNDSILGKRWRIVKWSKKFDCFQQQSSLWKYEDTLAVKESADEKNCNIYSYDLDKINALDLKEISEICFCADDQTENEDIWEKLIEYFDKRGIYPEESE